MGKEVLPILITTYNRYEYFQKMYVSLYNSLDYNNIYYKKKIINIYDDCSTEKNITSALKMLNECHKVNFREKNVGTTLNTLQAIDQCFEYYSTDYVVALQSDIIFCETWLDRGMTIFEKIIERYKDINIGFLGLFNRSNKENRHYYILKTGHPGGCAWIVRRKFWDNYKNKFAINDDITDILTYCDISKGPKNAMTRHKIKNLVDYKLAHRAHSINWHCAKVGDSLVQHIGHKSSVSDRDMSEFDSTCFIRN